MSAISPKVDASEGAGDRNDEQKFLIEFIKH